MRRRAGFQSWAGWRAGAGLSLAVHGSTLAAAALSGAAALVLAGCVNDTPSTDPPEDVQKYILDKVPEGEKMTALNVNFDDKITLLGAQVEPLDAEPGSRVKVTMYWRVDKALDDVDWKLFTHVLDGSGERLMNIDNVGPLRHIRRNRQSWAPGNWLAGKVYVDTQSFTMPRKLKGSKVQLVTGIWKGRQRLPLKSGPSITDNRALVATFNTGVAAKAEDGVPEVQAARIKEGLRLRLDGKLSEYAWDDATPLTFVNVANGKPLNDTGLHGTAKVLWDETALYFGIFVKDQDVVGGFDKAAKDPQLWTKDTVELMIDPDGDGDNKDYYEIQVNPQGLVFDSYFEDYNKPRTEPNGPFGHQEWSSKLESAVTVRGTIDNSKDKDEGYVVEIKIPWTSFDKAKKVPPEPGTTWRMNVYAMENNDGVAWSPILGEGNFHKASRFGKVTFVTQPAAVATAQGAAAGTTAPAAAEQPARGDLTVEKKALQQAPASPAAAPAQTQQ